MPPPSTATLWLSAAAAVTATAAAVLVYREARARRAAESRDGTTQACARGCCLAAAEARRMDGAGATPPRRATGARVDSSDNLRSIDAQASACSTSTHDVSVAMAMAGGAIMGAALEAPSPLRQPRRGGEKADPYSALKRKGYLEWDDYFMAVAFLSAMRSKDPNRQVGACIVNPDRIILGIGYNGFPRGCSDDALPWAKLASDGDPLKTKYPYVCHAEMNAILNKNNSNLHGASIYVSMYPCNECAKLIIQAGVTKVVFYTGKLHAGDGKVDASYVASSKMFELAGVQVYQHQPDLSHIGAMFQQL